MTAQIEDYLIWDPKTYRIIAILADKGSKLFDPNDYRMEPKMMGTGCYRGYYCEYRLDNGTLTLDMLKLRSGDRFRRIAGVCTAEIDSRAQTAVYKNLNLKIPFSGILRIGDGFMWNRYEHMGFQRESCYRTVIDVTFREGELIGQADVTDAVRRQAALQKQIDAFTDNNWLPLEYEIRLRDQFGFLDKDDIGETFMRKMQAHCPGSFSGIRHEIRQLQKRPRWFIFNYTDYYEREHSYHLEIGFLDYLGLPLRVCRSLAGLVSEPYTEQQVVVSFLECLRTTRAADIWGEAISAVIGEEYLLAKVPPELRARMETLTAGVTPDSWNWPKTRARAGRMEDPP